MMRLNVVKSIATRAALACGFVLTLGLAPALRAQEAEPLTLDRLFVAGEFFGGGIGQVRWLEEGGYTTLERSEAVRGGREQGRFSQANDGTDHPSCGRRPEHGTKIARTDKIRRHLVGTWRDP